MVSPILPRLPSRQPKKRSVSSDLESLLTEQAAQKKKRQRARDLISAEQLATEINNETIIKQIQQKEQLNFGQKLMNDVSAYQAYHTGQSSDFRPSQLKITKDASILPSSLRDEPKGNEFSESGFLGMLLRAPGISHVMGTLSKAYEYGVNPIAQELIAGVQGWIPGEQELERRMDEATQAARARGDSWIGRLKAGYEAGRDVDLPSAIVSLPFEVPIPSWIAGEEKSLKDIQFGVRGLAEVAVGLPFEIAAGKGIGKIVKGLKKSRNVPPGKSTPYARLMPGSPEYLKMYKEADPVMRAEMRDYAKRLKLNKPTRAREVFEKDKNPLPDGVQEGSALGDTIRNMRRSVIPATGIIAKIKNAPQTVRAKLFDQAPGIEDMNRRVRKEWLERYGTDVPDEIHAAASMSVMSGAPSAARVRIDEVTKSVTSVLGKDIDDEIFSSYVIAMHGVDQAAAKGAQRIIAGRVRGPEGAKQILKDIEKSVSPDHWNRMKVAHASIVKHFDGYLDDMVSSGLVPKKDAALFRKTYPNYIPTMYYKYIEDIATGQLKDSAGRRVSSVSSNGLRAASDEGLDISKANWRDVVNHHGYRAEMLIRRNDSAKSILRSSLLDSEVSPLITKVTNVRKIEGVKGITEDAFVAGKGDVPGAIQFMENGKHYAYKVPDWLYKEANAMPEVAGHGSLATIGRVMNAFPRMALVTYNPAFMAAQGILDTLTVAIGNRVMPWETGAALLKNLRSITKADPGLKRMIQSGGDVMGWWGKDANKAYGAAIKGGNFAIKDDSGWKALLGTAAKRFNHIKDIGHAIEMAPRRAVFERSLQRGSSERVAAMLARRSTVDFSRGGSAVMAANNWWLFLNPAVQGALIPWRALREPLTSRFFKQGISSYMAANVAAYYWNRQFPEYYDIPMWERVGSLSFMLPSNEIDPRTGRKKPHRISLIPMEREFTAFTAPMELLLSKLDGQGPDDSKEIFSELLMELNPIGQASAVPTYLGSKVFDIMRNHDSFKDRPIVDPELENLPVEQQFDVYNSELSKRVGAHIGVSPKKIDFLLRDGVSRDLFALVDAVLGKVNGEDPEIEGMAAFLKDLSDNYGDEETKLIRRTLYGQLSAEDRQKLEDAERKPEPGLELAGREVPFLSTMINRFYKKYSGQMYRTGFASAAKEAGVSDEGIRHLNGLLSNASDEELERQEQADGYLEEGLITGPQWRGARKDGSAGYKAILTAMKAIFPGEAALLADEAQRSEFYDSIYTLAGKVKDLRSKGELLLSARRAIPIPLTPGGTEDWTAYYASVDSFLTGLNQDEQNLLEKFEIASMTDTERQFTLDSRMFAPYWDTYKRILEYNPARIQVYEKYLRSELAGSPRTEFLEEYPWIAETYKLQNAVKNQMRISNPALEEFLYKWGYIDALVEENGLVVHQDIFNRRYEIAPWRRVVEAELLRAASQEQRGAAAG